MVFTIGKSENYDIALKNPPSFKVGKNDKEHAQGVKDYPGGIIFESIKDAKNYLETFGFKDYGIYEVKACWKEDCGDLVEKKSLGLRHKALLNSSEILRKVF